MKLSSRTGVQKYGSEDTNSLLDLTDLHIFPGHNHLAMVEEGFKEFCTENESPVRELEFLRNKFDKLCNSKKPTGYADFPPAVSRAKQIARDIQCKAAACVLGVNDSERDQRTDTNDCRHMDDAATPFATVGEHNKKKRVAACGVKFTPQKKPKKNGDLLQYVGTRTDHLGSISKPIAESKTSRTSQDLLRKADVIEIVNENMRPTNAVIAHIISVVEKLAHMRE